MTIKDKTDIIRQKYDHAMKMHEHCLAQRSEKLAHDY